MIATRNKRPVFLDLLKMRLPIGAIASIGHRIGGVLMVLVIPYLLYLLERSISGSEGFAAVGETVAGWPFRLFLFVILWALTHHFLAGIRHLLLDVAIGVDKPLFRRSAWAVLLASPILALLLTGGLP